VSGRVLVTGAGGFLGRAVLPRLAAAGWEVRAVRRSATDLLDPAAVDALLARERPTHLLHLAWCTDPRRDRMAAENAAWADASEHLLRAFAGAGGRRAVIAGSILDGDATTAYGAAKGTLRERATTLAAEAGWSLAWPRISIVYGPGERPNRLVPSLVRGLLERAPVELSHGRQERDFVHLDDAAAALARLTGAAVEGVADLGSGEPRTIREVAEAVAGRLGGRDLLRFGARDDDGGPPVLRADTTRLREELGWRPSVPFAEGLDAAVSWWVDRLRPGAAAGSRRRA
jgi:nucleoside-diphosphate-sugar epimerase